MSSDYQLEDTIYLPFTTRAFATGIPTALVSGVIDIYEDVTATPIVTAETLTVSLNGHGGFNMITVTATGASGFGVGQSYTAILDAGTVGGVSVIGEVVAHFTIDKSAAAQDLANGTDGLSAIKTETASIQSDTNDIQTRLPAALVGGAMDSDVSAMQAGSIAAGTIAAGELTNIENEIWDALKSAHVVANSFGDFLDIEVSSRVVTGGDVNVASMDANSIAAGTIAAGELTNIEDEIWDALKSAHVVANSFGDFLDIEVSSRLASADINLTAGVLDEVAALTGHTAQTGDSFARLGAPAAASVSADILAIDNFVDGIETTLGVAGVGLSDLGGMSTAMQAEVLAEVNTALDTVISELSQGVPATTPTVRTALMLMYMALRNQLDVATVATDTLEIHNDAGTRIAQKLLTDDGTDYSEAKMISGA